VTIWVPDPQPPLKCVVLAPATVATRDAVRAALAHHVDAGEISAAGDGALVVNTDATTAVVRDWIEQAADAAEACVLVVAFEHWSSRGGCVDRVWLGQRGH
jgi:hypothetical protein